MKNGPRANGSQFEDFFHEFEEVWKIEERAGLNVYGDENVVSSVIKKNL